MSAFLMKEDTLFFIKFCNIKNRIFNPFAGGLISVEKVKPDPLNLLVNTGVGKQIIKMIVFDKGCLLNSAAPFYSIME